MRSNNNRVLFDDNSATTTLPDHDWAFIANDTFAGGREYLAIRDHTNNRTIFTVEAGARTDALYVDDTSRIGIGERDPVEDLHMTTSDSPTIRLSQEGAFGDQAFDIGANETNFFIRDVQANTLPLRLLDDTPTGMLGITADGVGIRTNDAIGNIDIRATLDVNGDALIRTDLEVTGSVGIGTDTPEAPLHILAGNNNADFIFEQTNGANAAKWIIRNNAATGRITFRNDTTGLTPFKFGQNATENLFRVGVVGNNIVDVNGNMDINGTLTTNGSCSVGCDAVFADDYDLPSIEAHNSAMWDNGFLPNVGPTLDGEPLNVADKMGRMLNELEHAHIFIGELNQELDRANSEIAEQKRLNDVIMARLSALETQ
ncbi:MAG: hypothetical protein ACSHWS_05615 [Sulfitobacter sp.]